MNFGGPGDAGTETLPLAVDTIPPEIRDRFDIVSFDPCVAPAAPGPSTASTIAPPISSSPRTPRPTTSVSSSASTPSNSQVDVNGVPREVRAVARRGRRATWRDVDRISAALGENRINYLGYSYGTVLGAAYAQEFPTHVRTMVLDGA